MTNCERLRRTLNFQPVDRLPMVEWATWWDKTIERWHAEGLPGEIRDAAAISLHLGLDDFRQCWVSPRGPDFKNQGAISSLDDYQKVKNDLYPEDAFDRQFVRGWVEKQKTGETAVWITLEGFFWFPRTLFGIEKHLYAFYDAPDLMHRINSDLLDFNLRVLDEFCSLCVPDFMTFGEDMSYNLGPMISKKIFDEFMAPYYRRIVPKIKEYGIVPIIDSDGDIKKIIPWFLEVGVDGFLPLERQAGVDLNELRREYPRVRFIGGYDKMVMSKGEKEMRPEFERLLPAMKSGGYIPSVDHQTPPGVSLANYRIYLKLLKEYCDKACN
ncbi:MAG: hypothetical protein KJ935_06215 [Candidatus Omnitrophica bacterium]|nr:hypothetical protein [Candidatus Omnitrophota bacterium]